MDYIINETSIRFFEQAPSPWYYLILVVPLVLGGIGIYFLVVYARDGITRMQALGLVFMGLLFAPLPWVLADSYTGYQVLLDASQKQLQIVDSQSTRAGPEFNLPYRDLLAYVLATHSSTDSDGRNSVSYSLQLISREGLRIRLFESSDNKEIQIVQQAAQKKLALPVVASIRAAADLASRTNVSALPLDPARICEQNWVAIQARYNPANQSCSLHWTNRTHPMLYLGIGLPMLAFWYLGIRIRSHGYGHMALFPIGIVLVIFLAFVSVILRSWQSASQLELTKTAIESRVDSMFPLFDYQTKMRLDQIRSIQASTDPGDTSIVLYSRNPLADGLDISSIWQNIRDMQGLMLYTDGLPVIDRLQLIRILVRASDW